MAENGKMTKTAAAPRKPRATKAKTEQPVHDAPNGSGMERPTKGPQMVTQDEIRALAHKYWVERGRPHGGHEQDWYRAEQELRGKAS